MAIRDAFTAAQTQGITLSLFGPITLTTKKKS